MNGRLSGGMLLALAGLLGVSGCVQSVPTASAPAVSPSPSPSPKSAAPTTQAASPSPESAPSAQASPAPRPRPTPPSVAASAASTHADLTALVVRPSVGILPLTTVQRTVGYAALHVGHTAELPNYQTALRGAIDLSKTMQLQPDSLSSVG